MRQVLKVKEVVNLLKTGKPANLVVCSYDKNRPAKSGKRLELNQVTYCSNKGYLVMNVRRPNGETVECKPCLIEAYNGTTVTP